MTAKFMTPSVYIGENNAFQNSVLGVPTAIPIFIGYTQKAEFQGDRLEKKPIRINSFLEYIERFGMGYKSKFSVTKLADPPLTEEEKRWADAVLVNPEKVIVIDNARWLISIKDKQTAFMYNAIRLFYGNGGGTCYILSLGTYAGKDYIEIRIEDFTADEIFESLEKESEPTLIVMPDLIHTSSDAYSVYDSVLAHCQKVKSRFAIFDLAKRTADGRDGTMDIIGDFRDRIGTNALDYGAAYYPWLKTSIVSASEVNLDNLEIAGGAAAFFPEPEAKAILKRFDEEQALIYEAKPKKRAKAKQPTLNEVEESLDRSLKAVSPTYVAVLEKVRAHLNVLPPSAAIAGIYAMVDRTRGVWKSPANVSVSSVYQPFVSISHTEQELLNVDGITGKSINAIRAFANSGTLVWGARTLDGKSQDWRYISVRRTVIMIEQSLKFAIRGYVFEPNNANTWLVVKSMIDNYLIDLWKQGALVGETPEQAFDVQIGLGSTMTPTDVLEGRMLISVKVAIVRPAEFIVITFEQQLLQS